MCIRDRFKSVKIEVVFIPLLAYDLKGNRVGYGKGFYDRFLKKLSKNTNKIGLSFFLPENYISDCSNHDIQMDYCVSPEKVFNFLWKKFAFTSYFSKSLLSSEKLLNSFMCTPSEINIQSIFKLFAPLISVLKLSPTAKTFSFDLMVLNLIH